MAVAGAAIAWPEGPTPMERLDAMISMPDAALVSAAERIADELLLIGERALESWLVARNEIPTSETAEGFRLLALHRQGARGTPSFNACRETCRELVYHRNCSRSAPQNANVSHTIRLGAMVARHLVLFIDGKLEVAGLGDFCCSSRPLRAYDTTAVGAS